MEATKHKITHYYQPTSNTCGYAALAILLSHYGQSKTPKEIVGLVPQPTDENGKPIGSITAQLAAWCVNEGYKVDFTSFDVLITDLSWQNLSNDELVAKLEQVKNVRDVSNVGGKVWSRIYAQAYIDLIKAGGNLNVSPHPTSKSLYELLQHAPVYANIAPSVVYGKGRSRTPEPDKRLDVPDDINGTVGTHSVVIYGNDTDGNFLVADPWHGLVVIPAETMLCGITAAQLECDNQIFRLLV